MRKFVLLAGAALALAAPAAHATTQQALFQIAPVGNDGAPSFQWIASETQANDGTPILTGGSRNGVPGVLVVVTQGSSGPGNTVIGTDYCQTHCEYFSGWPSSAESMANESYAPGVYTINYIGGDAALSGYVPFQGGFPSSSTVGAVNLAETLTITAVPEPATWAMLILGVSVIGVSLRRRRQGAFAPA